MTTDNILMWVTRLSIVGRVYSKTQIFLRIQNQLWEESYVVFGSRTFVPVSWMCKKKTSVSHSSSESEIISLDAGLRMDGLPDLDLWDVVVEVLRSSNSTKPPTNPAAGNFPRNHKSNPRQKGNPKMLSDCRMRTTLHKRKFFSRRVSVVHL